MQGIQTDTRASALLAPVEAVLADALRHLPGSEGAMSVSLGEVDGFSELRGDELVLSTALAGPDLVHPLEPDGPIPPLDRWRRAMCCVLEAVAMRALAARTGRPIAEDWRWRGLGVWAAATAAPEAGLALPELALALQTGDLAAHPRAGAAVYRAWQARGEDPWARAEAVLVTDPTPEEWLALGVWAMGSQGLAALLPLPVSAPPPSDIPLTLGPWRWQPLLVPAHARGGRVLVEGDGAVAAPWARAGEPLRTLAASTGGGCRLLADAGGPVGVWQLTSAHGFGQVFGVRGVEFDLRASGKLEIVMADAFAGPLAALEMAEHMGTSGVATGVWKVDGPQRLRFDRITHQGLTMHGRDASPFVVPGGGSGMEEWIGAMSHHPWGWRAEQDHLVLSGRLFGGEVEMWWRKRAD